MTQYVCMSHTFKLWVYVILSVLGSVKKKLLCNIVTVCSKSIIGYPPNSTAGSPSISGRRVKLGCMLNIPKLWKAHPSTKTEERVETSWDKAIEVQLFISTKLVSRLVQSLLVGAKLEVMAGYNPLGHLLLDKVKNPRDTYCSETRQLVLTQNDRLRLKVNFLCVVCFSAGTETLSSLCTLCSVRTTYRTRPWGLHDPRSGCHQTYFSAVWIKRAVAPSSGCLLHYCLLKGVSQWKTVGLPSNNAWTMY